VLTRHSVSLLRRRTAKTIYRLSTPIRPNTLRSALDRVCVGGAGIMFVHSSLSSCGHHVGGPHGVLDILGEFCNTLCLPTHSYCYPESSGLPGPVFNAATTPSRVGRLSEIFRQRAGSLRSIHATHSLAASGNMAEELCADHYRYETPCGAGTPYTRLIAKHAAVLMFGVSFAYYTLFHTAESESDSRCAFLPGQEVWLRVIDESGQQRDCWSRRQNFIAPRFDQVGDFLERVGLVRRTALGHGTLLFVPDCSGVHDSILERLRREPDFLRTSCTSEM